MEQRHCAWLPSEPGLKEEAMKAGSSQEGTVQKLEEFSRTKASRVLGQKEAPKFHKLGSVSLSFTVLSKQETLRQTHRTFPLVRVTEQGRRGEGPVTATRGTKASQGRGGPILRTGGLDRSPATCSRGQVQADLDQVQSLSDGCSHCRETHNK